MRASSVTRAAPERPSPRVAFLSVSGTMGGAEWLLLELVAGMRERDPRQEIHVVVASPGPLVDALRARGVDVHELRIPDALAALGDSPAAGRGGRLRMVARLLVAVPALLGFAWRLRRRLTAIAPAIVHSNGFKMHVVGALATPRGARLVWHLHDFVSSRPVMRGLLRRLRGRCAAAVAISRSVHDDARAALGDDVTITTVYDAIDTARFDGGARADLDALGSLPPAPPGPTEPVRIGLVATMAWWKGHELFLRALARLRERGGWRGYVVGGALYRTTGSEARVDALRALATSLGIADRVGFTGHVGDSAGAMRALDVVVHASTAPEPFGLVIAEGMAAGRAVVASDAGAPPELVADGVDGLLFACGDDAALADRLARLLDDAALRGRLGAAARESARRRFGRDRLAKEVAAVHQRAVLAVAPRPRPAPGAVPQLQRDR